VEAATDLKSEDLVTVCPRCKGQQNIVEVHGSGGGQPGIGPTRTFGPCPGCKGEGAKLTQVGQVLEQFLRQLRSMGRL